MVQAEMNRDLEVVRDYTDYILSEDLTWSSKHSTCCKAHRKYAIHASSRSMLENEAKVPSEEVQNSPVIFQVREKKNYCGSDKDVHFGVFHSYVPDDPTWPEEAPLLYWRDPHM